MDKHLLQAGDVLISPDALNLELSQTSGLERGILEHGGCLPIPERQTRSVSSCRRSYVVPRLEPFGGCAHQMHSSRLSPSQTFAQGAVDSPKTYCYVAPVISNMGEGRGLKRVSLHTFSKNKIQLIMQKCLFK